MNKKLELIYKLESIEKGCSFISEKTIDVASDIINDLNNTPKSVKVVEENILTLEWHNEDEKDSDKYHIEVELDAGEDNNDFIGLWIESQGVDNYCLFKEVDASKYKEIDNIINFFIK